MKNREKIAEYFEELGFHTVQSLHDVWQDESSPAIKKIIAKCFIESCKSGEWQKCKDIIEQAIGKAKSFQEIEIIEDTGERHDLGRLTDDELKEFIRLSEKCSTK